VNCVHDSSLTRAVPERLTDEQLIIKRYKIRLPFIFTSPRESYSDCTTYPSRRRPRDELVPGSVCNLS